MNISEVSGPMPGRLSQRCTSCVSFRSFLKLLGKPPDLLIERGQHGQKGLDLRLEPRRQLDPR